MYLVLSLLFKVFGVRKVMRFFPPIVTGPIIIAIGLSLSSSAVNNCATSWPVSPRRHPRRHRLQHLGQRA
ncbi:MAG: solute carrier family 23 protein [Lachnospiraceae bacterium]